MHQEQVNGLAGCKDDQEQMDGLAGSKDVSGADGRISRV